MAKECMSPEERNDHYKKHNHRVVHPHDRESARKMDTRKMQVVRHARVREK